MKLLGTSKSFAGTNTFRSSTGLGSVAFSSPKATIRLLNKTSNPRRYSIRLRRALRALQLTAAALSRATSPESRQSASNPCLHQIGELVASKSSRIARMDRCLCLRSVVAERSEGRPSGRQPCRRNSRHLLDVNGLVPVIPRLCSGESDFRQKLGVAGDSW